MATVEDWQKYINLLHELALIEDDLRNTRKNTRYSKDSYDAGMDMLAEQILFERFGVDV